MTYAKYEDGQIITTISGSKRLKAYCVACDEPVHFVKDHTRKHPSKDQKIDVRAHFRHTNDIHVTEAFLRQHRPESIAHLAAKQALVAGNFFFFIRCGGCDEIIPIKLEGERREEVPYNKYRLDVAYMSGDNVVGGVEVLHSSRVSHKKVRFLDKNLPWCEVKAEKVLKSTGHIFAERSHNQICEKCKVQEACEAAARARRVEEARMMRVREENRLKQEEKMRLEKEREEQEQKEREQKEREQKERKELEARNRYYRQEKQRIEEEKRQERIEEERRFFSGTIEGKWKKYQEEMDPFKELFL